MSLRERYFSIRDRTLAICKPLSIEDHLMQPIMDVSPPKWHLAHTTWFFESFILNKYVEGYVVFDERFPFYFNSYYQSMGERQERDKRGLLTRPTTEKIYAYREYVDEHMSELLKTPSDVISGLVEIGLNHEQQHQELLLTDIKYSLYSQPFHPVYSAEPLIQDARALPSESKEWISIPEGTYQIGHDEDGFAFDNECKRHTVYLHKYSISSSPITNGEFIEFIESGGYSQFQHWHDEGWAWVNRENAQLPLYWEKQGDAYMHFTLRGLEPVDPNAILQHVNYYEAAAYAAWRGGRLPTEAEWEVASEHFSWGDVWEWTNSAYLPYPGYQKPEGAIGEYNGKFMINQMVLRGASIATSPNHSRHTYRNFFHPHLQWQFSGMRLVKDETQKL
ncbi:ergothioneine biosynthesis protein EgtB [Phaeocystidibacter marisrubri]|uniref:Ergothioneine biosynthesis protein EgtB n=1 Tax=Phaeocystidibacter marisrubri TaxID=1577780 RepID=A0A6L3ZKI4_9FLAO|nr:ergothioneine biosynthesis protein EgtB [Phaeocystidibacter marisrubri]KAB2818058.1 ergothioneine biosynthesis protein EgtB [Phaeocystidibacter marisrubri]GGH72165.1 ergothioneine biosynthesis protein EgtB [Phaeocystidibacter marisrubri]